MGMEYWPSECLTTSENSSNSQETPRNAEQEEEEPCPEPTPFLISVGLWKVEPRKSRDNEAHRGFN